MQRSGTTLLIVDAQVALLDDEVPPFNRDAVLATLKDALARARSSKTPVVFVQHIDDEFAALQPGSPGFETHPEIAPLPGEPIVHKRVSNSFVDTTLKQTLDRSGTTSIVLGGMQTELCIDSTARGAISQGYNVVVIADGHTTWDQTDMTAEQVIDFHNSAWPAIAHEEHKVVVKHAADVTF